MSMKLYYQAIRAMPEEWVSDATITCRFGNDAVLATNPTRPAHKYTAAKGWEAIKHDPNAAPPKERLVFDDNKLIGGG